MSRGIASMLSARSARSTPQHRKRGAEGLTPCGDTSASRQQEVCAAAIRYLCTMDYLSCFYNSGPHDIRSRSPNARKPPVFSWPND